MKTYIILAIAFLFQTCLYAQVENPADATKNAATNATNNNIDNSANSAVNKVENGIKGIFKKKNKSNNSNNNNNQQPQNTNSATQNTNASNTSDNTTSAAPSLQSYQNYDFVPGDTVLFEDHFADDQDGEFPSHWDLEKGQAVLNKVNETLAFFLTEGNYVEVYPRMKTKTYLTDPFTIEFDYYPSDGTYGVVLFLKYLNSSGDEDKAHIQFGNNGEVSTGYFNNNFSASYPNENDATYMSKWHHCAMIYKNHQIKCYIDQNRILVMPNVDFIPNAFGFGGIGDQQHPIVIANIRAAKGGKMNMIGKKFTESKIVTHGINFDIDKAIIRPESMGTLNLIVSVMKTNPDIKFEVDGHTDNSGETAHNMTLSQQRADAVKMQLVNMGIDASRLTAKGFGDTKPIDTNETPEGKANNRRVEFVKK